jgi:serine/alanine adding enzyme
MRIEAIQLLPANLEEQWKSFLNGIPAANYFQSPTHYRFLKSCSELGTQLFLAIDEHDQIVGSLIATTYQLTPSIPYFNRVVIHGGPLLSLEYESSVQILSSLLKELKHHYRKNSVYIEFRNLFDWVAYKKIFEDCKFRYEHWLNFILETPDMQKVWPGINDGKRRQIQASLDKGAKVIIAENENQVEQFYRILAKLYKKKIGKPLPSPEFFKEFFNFSNKTGDGVFLLVEYQGEIIGGMCSPIFGNDTIYEWYICGSDKDYNPLGVYPSVMATWGGIEYALKNNINRLDFLGAGKPEIPYGVREFKKQFGGKLVNYGRFTYVNNKILYTLGEQGVKLLKYRNKLLGK